MASPRPKGVVIRPVADWLAPFMMGGRSFTAALAANVSYGELFNNATDGSYLWVYGATGNTISLNAIVLESYKGQKGTPNGLIGMLQSDQPLGPGVIGTFTTPICVGTEIGAIDSNSSQGFFPWAFPAAIIPPGYSFSMHPANQNVALEAAYWWTSILGS